MKEKVKRKLAKFADLIALPIDILLVPFVFTSALIMLITRKIGLQYLKICRKVLLTIGVIPIVRHYYEPLFDERDLSKPLSTNRSLPGIDWNEEEQISLLNKFNYSNELNKIPETYVDEKTFSFDNGSFASGDAEYLYNIIRLKKPKTIIEIGSGHSTKIARMAIDLNKKEDARYECQHICIEPYEVPWLEKSGVQVIRQRVEEVKKDIFKKLGKDDLLFIDSSHIIRPQGDVIYEYLELLPTLNKGVLVHIHDIFSPNDYPYNWVFKNIKLWNEQYLLEAFLTSNRNWKIVGALNFLHHRHYSKLKEKCPKLTKKREPGSFYIVKVA